MRASVCVDWNDGETGDISLPPLDEILEELIFEELGIEIIFHRVGKSYFVVEFWGGDIVKINQFWFADNFEDGIMCFKLAIDYVVNPDSVCSVLSQFEKAEIKDEIDLCEKMLDKYNIENEMKIVFPLIKELDGKKVFKEEERFVIDVLQELAKQRKIDGDVLQLGSSALKRRGYYTTELVRPSLELIYRVLKDFP